MSYKVELIKQAEKEFAKIDYKDQVRVSAALLEIKKNPFIGKKLKGKFDGFWSHKVWPYRIIYEIKKKRLIILVIKIGHRQGVY